MKDSHAFALAGIFLVGIAVAIPALADGCLASQGCRKWVGLQPTQLIQPSSTSPVPITVQPGGSSDTSECRPDARGLLMICKPVNTPEPAGWAVLLVGAVAVVVARRKQRT